MHGCSSGLIFLVNAEVDSMGGVLDGGIGINSKTSPRQSAIEKAQEELRQEYDVREERRRELEFLEKGGNPLDFNFGLVTSVSVQSTSLAGQPPEQIATSEAKGSFALAASPLGDSVESSGRPGGPTPNELNSADNLLLFDGGNELSIGGKNSRHPGRRSNIALSEQSSHLDGSQNAKESEDSAIFRPYARRNRSRSNRDATRTSSTDIVPSRGSYGSAFSSRHGPKDAKRSIPETYNQKDQNRSVISSHKSPNLDANMVLKVAASSKQLNMELDGMQILETSTGLTKDAPPCGTSVIVVPKETLRSKHYKLGSPQTHTDLLYTEPAIEEGKQLESASLEYRPSATSVKIENAIISTKPNGFCSLERDRNSLTKEGQNNHTEINTKSLGFDSCTQTNVSLDGNNRIGPYTGLDTVGSDRNLKEQTLAPASTEDEVCKLMVGEEDTSMSNVGGINFSDGHTSVHVEEELHKNVSGLQNELNPAGNVSRLEMNNQAVSNDKKEKEGSLVDKSKPGDKNFHTVRPHEDMNSSTCELSKAGSSGRGTADVPDALIRDDNHLKMEKKQHEDSILDEAQIIEAKHKRISELSVGTLPAVNRPSSHWEFVLEEMAWLANDFAQERLWKIDVAAQISRHIALTSRSRFEEKNLYRKQRTIGHKLAEAVMKFWHSAEMLVGSDCQNVGLKNCKHDLIGSGRFGTNEVAGDEISEANKDTIEDMASKNNTALAIRDYAVKFLKDNCCSVNSIQPEPPETPDSMSDLGVQDMSWEDRLSEESLFYAVPPGAIATYRKSVETYLIRPEKTRSSMQEEVETSTRDPIGELSQGNEYDEDEGETNTYYFPGAFEGRKSLKFSQKKRKLLLKSYTSRPYEMGADMPYRYCPVGPRKSHLMGKRSANNINAGPIPTKRMRTASRSRLLSPFSSGAQLQNRTDASSGETNSFQDDQSTLQGGSQMHRSLEVELADIEKHLPYDSGEISKPKKKKKKSKHLSSTYEQRWQFDSSIYNEQRDYSKKRLETHHYESNESNGLFGQNNSSKKPKIMKQALENTVDNVIQLSGSISSPVTSQVSNMSNTNKLMKIIGGRDRGRKTKILKIPSGQLGAGTPWSLFEDQALVVLVHDMGPNWELVSDAINSTLHFKYIFRKPQECLERHKFLMDRTAGAGDGADSAEDSGSSQPYPSTLPGIPKGSARQLFQRLQGPVEEDTLKSHFEKIISIGQWQQYRKSQSDNQDLKQLAPVHNSHVIALSQVLPSNLNGGFLTPLDHCDAIASSTDIHPVACQGPHSTGLSPSNQSTITPMNPVSGANTSSQVSSVVVLGNNMATSGPLNSSSRYAGSRSSLPTDEQQRLQHYNPMLSGRNIQQQPGLAISGTLSGNDRNARMLPTLNGASMMSGINRGVPMPRPGFQGIASSSMLNSGNMLSSGMVGMPSTVNRHPGVGSGQGNPMMRPREPLHLIRPGQNLENQRQMVGSELQMQVTQGNSSGLASNFPNQTVPPPSQTYHPHPHQMPTQQPHLLSGPHNPHLSGPNHTSSMPYQAYARLAKERQLQHHQHRLVQQQQQQQFPASGALLSHVQPPHAQLPPHNGAQMQPQSSQQVSLCPLSPSSPMTPVLPQLHQKHHLPPPHGLGRNSQTGVAGGLTSQMGKQRHRQPQQQQFQQSSRHHPQQRQQSESQQVKLLKGMGRGNMMMHQNLPIDSAHLNGLSTSPGSQGSEKGEQTMPLIQGQGLYAGAGVKSVQPSRSLVNTPPPNKSQLQQKFFSGPPPPPPKQLQPMPPHSDGSNQCHVLPGASAPTSTATPNQADDHASLAGGLSQSCLESRNVAPITSGAQWKASELLGTCGNLPLAMTSGSEPILPGSQGLARRQLSGGVQSRHSIGEHWQQHSQLKQPQAATLPLQQQRQLEKEHEPSQQQLSQHQQSQQNLQAAQAGQVNMYIRPTN